MVSYYVRWYYGYMYIRFILETNIDRIVSYVAFVYPVLQVEILNNLPDVASGFFIALKTY